MLHIQNVLTYVGAKVGVCEGATVGSNQKERVGKRGVTGVSKKNDLRVQNKG
jgi:hypothetical protein